MMIRKKIIYNLDLKPYDNHFIKLIVLNKTDDEQFDKFVERLYNEITVHDLKYYRGLFRY